jgi:oligoribonuclease
MKPKQHLAWVDIETTGLNPEQDRILEVALVITDTNLTEVAHLTRVLFTENVVLETMGPWCVDMHAQNGLSAECRESTMTRPSAERDLLELLRAYTTNQGSPLCGSSPHFDRAFLHKQMPTLASWFHYRNLDVSSVRQIVSLWCPERLKPSTTARHRALDDIRGSIAELQHYRHALGLGVLDEVAA